MKKIIAISLIGLFFLSGFGAASFNNHDPTEIEKVTMSTNYDMVIIAPSLFYDELQPLIDHKNSYGVETFLKTTEEIYSQYSGRDNPEKIKYFIKDAIEKYDIDYVLLIGDVYKTPIRKTEVNQIWPGENLTQIDDIITDLYYADIYDEHGNFSSWDTNNDNIFSECYVYNIGMNPGEIIVIDEVDLHPDVGIGRIPCENIDELEIVINKIINYETQTYGEEWFNRIILVGADNFPEEGSEGEIVMESIAEVMDGFDHIKIYDSLNNLNPNEINKKINEGAGFLTTSTHGSPRLFHNYMIPSIKKLHNTNMLPVVFLEGCFCGMIDHSIYEILSFYSRCFHFNLTNSLNFLQLLNIDVYKLRPSIAWEFLKYKDGGSIATIGDTESGTQVRGSSPLNGFNSLFNLKFFESYEPGITLSKMYNNGLNSFINASWKNYVTVQSFILLGDPSLKVGGHP